MRAVPAVPGAAFAVGGWARKYVVPPRYRRRERLSLIAGDGTRLSVARLEGPPSAPLAVVLVHGFVNWSRAPAIHALAHRLAADVHVVVPDLRGHGRSGGRCTLGRTEIHDVAAAVAAAPPGLPVVTVGVSLGGAAALLHAGTYGGVAGVVALSPPASWGPYDRGGSLRIQRWVATPVSRAVLATLLRTRVAPDWGADIDSARVMGGIAPAFTLVVHDPDDGYFGPEHAEQIYGWAAEPRELWWMPGGGHGNDLLTPAFADRLLAAILAKVAAAPDARAPGAAAYRPGTADRSGAADPPGAEESGAAYPPGAVFSPGPRLPPRP